MATKQRRKTAAPDPAPSGYTREEFEADGSGGQGMPRLDPVQPVVVHATPAEVREARIAKQAALLVMHDHRVGGRQVFTSPCGLDKNERDYLSRSVSGRWYRICAADVNSGSASVDPDNTFGWREVKDAETCRVLDEACSLKYGVTVSNDNDDEEDEAEEPQTGRRRRRSTPDADDAAGAKPKRKKRRDGLRPGSLPALMYDLLNAAGTPIGLRDMYDALVKNDATLTPKKVYMGAMNAARRDSLRFDAASERIGLPGMKECAGWVASKRKLRGAEKAAAKAAARAAKEAARAAKKEARKKRRRKSASLPLPLVDAPAATTPPPATPAVRNKRRRS